MHAQSKIIRIIRILSPLLFIDLALITHIIMPAVIYGITNIKIIPKIEITAIFTPIFLIYLL